MADQALVPAERIVRGLHDKYANLPEVIALVERIAADIPDHLRRLRGYANLQGSFSAAHNGKTMVAKPVG